MSASYISGFSGTIMLGPGSPGVPCPFICNYKMVETVLIQDGGEFQAVSISCFHPEIKAFQKPPSRLPLHPLLQVSWIASVMEAGNRERNGL